MERREARPISPHVESKHLGNGYPCKDIDCRCRVQHPEHYCQCMHRERIVTCPECRNCGRPTGFSDGLCQPCFAMRLKENQPEPQHKSQEDIMREHDVCTKARTCVGGYKHDGYCYNKHGFVLGATIG